MLQPSGAGLRHAGQPRPRHQSAETEGIQLEPLLPPEVLPRPAAQGFLPCSCGCGSRGGRTRTGGRKSDKAPARIA